MSTHPGMLIAYDDDGDVIASVAYMVRFDANGNPLLVDFAAHEEAGREMTELWNVERDHGTVKGSKVWPEYLADPTAFRVELVGPAGDKRLHTLVHKESGVRRSRTILEGRIQARLEQQRVLAAEHGQQIRHELRRLGATDQDVARMRDPVPAPADISDLVGGPDVPLVIGSDGRAQPRFARP